MAETPSRHAKASEASDATNGDAATEQVQDQIAKEQAQGYRGGAPVDRTPNENYTVAGVTAGLPVPETAENPRVARAAAARQHGEE